MKSKAIFAMVLGLVTFAAGRTALAQAPEIAHDAVGCLVAGKYPKLKACFTPAADVAKARVYFRREDRPIWYHVEMAADGQCFAGILPRPMKELIGKTVPYYVEVASQKLEEGRTQEHAPQVVRFEAECKVQTVAPYLAKAAVKVFPKMPPGFSGGGAGTGPILGGLAAVGVGVGVLAGRGDGSSGPAPGVPTPAPPSPSPEPSPGPRPTPTPAPGNGPPTAVFAVNPDPPAGTSPMAVRFNLCRSSDPDNDPLIFRFDFGDGEHARGSCREEHTYRVPAAAGLAVRRTAADVVYHAKACVTDGRLGNDQCKTFEVRVQAEPIEPPPQASILTVALAGAGTGTVNGPGINCPGSCTASFPDGSAVTLTAAAGANSTFAGWSVAACGNAPTCSFTMAGSQTVTATFEAIPVAFPLTVTVGGNGTGSVTGPGGINCPTVSCTANFPAGSTVTLTANAAVGSMFARWSVAACGTATTCAITMNGPQAVTATFAPITTPFTLSVSLAGSGSGVVTSDPIGIDCPESCSASFPAGSTVTLTAAPDTNSSFGGWSVAACGTARICPIVLTADQGVTATFNLVAIPQDRASALSWVSDLRVGRGKGQVVINQQAFEVASGEQRASLEAPAGESRVEATLTQAGGAGTWRIELPDGRVEPGTLRVVEGKVEALTVNAVVFRLAGKPGEHVVFTFRLTDTASAP
jgi:hypothetical protein